MSEIRRFGEIPARLATIGLLSLALYGCALDSSKGSRTDLPLTEDAPSGFPNGTITSSVETFSTDNPKDMSIPRSEMTDPVGPSLNQVPSETQIGSVDGIPNPPGMINVLVSGQEAWVPTDENGYPEEEYTPFK